MLADLQRLIILLTPRQRLAMFGLFVGLLVASLFEMVGLGSIPAFVGLLADPERALLLLPAALAAPIAEIEPNRLVLYGATALAVLFLLKNLFLTLLIFATEQIVRRSVVSVSRRLFQGYLYSPYTFHLQRNPATLIRNTSAEPILALGLVTNVILILREILVLLVVFILLVLMDPFVSILIFILLALASTTFYLIVRNTLSRRGHLAMEHRATLTKVVTQSMGAIKDAKILGREPQLLGSFMHEVQGVNYHQAYQRVMSHLPRPFLEVLAISALLVVTAIFVRLGRPFEEMLPLLALLAVAVVRMVPAFNTITTALTAIRYNRASLALVSQELLQFKQHKECARSVALLEDQAYDGQGAQVRPLHGSLRLEQVSYCYPNTTQAVLKDVSLTIPVGQAVALIGASGSGKSTAVDVILGLLEPTSGRVMIDEWNLQTDLAAWQRQIGYIPQDIYLIDDTIRRNIAFGLTDSVIDESAIEAAIVAAQLDVFIASLPEGLDTVVGNRGIRLSGGQRQRIGIARALYHNPQVLVMDEATSALDNETERDVVAAIQRLRGDRTIIMIAHRLTTVRDCDQLYLLDAGQIVDHGTYAELSSRHRELRLAAVGE